MTARRAFLWLFVVMAGVTAILPHLEQKMFDAGVSVTAISLSGAVSPILSLIFIIAAISLSGRSTKRWWFLALVPIGFWHLLEGTAAYIIWNFRGFAP